MRNHMRLTLLPEADVLREVFQRMDRVLSHRAERAATRVAAVA
jgi:alanine-synthesizing transaminase